MGPSAGRLPKAYIKKAISRSRYQSHTTTVERSESGRRYFSNLGNLEQIAKVKWFRIAVDVQETSSWLQEVASFQLLQSLEKVPIMLYIRMHRLISE